MPVTNITTLNGVDTNTNVASLTASAFGSGQSWQDVTVSRAAVTVYTNSTSRPIMVVANFTEGNSSGDKFFTVNGVALPYVEQPGAGTYVNICYCVVPPGHTYQLTLGSATLTKWTELR